MPLVIPDTEIHPLSCDEPAIRELGLGAYLGVPLTTPEGEVIGVLCSVDRHAREWSSAHVEIAEGLAAAVMTEIGLRNAIERAREAAAERTVAEARYRSLIENIPLVTYMNSVEAPFTSLYMSPQVESLLGYTQEEWAAQPELARRRNPPRRPHARASARTRRTRTQCLHAL